MGEQVHHLRRAQRGEQCSDGAGLPLLRRGWTFLSFGSFGALMHLYARLSPSTSCYEGLRVLPVNRESE
jgi:hypothetical protein